MGKNFKCVRPIYNYVVLLNLNDCEGSRFFVPKVNWRIWLQSLVILRSVLSSFNFTFHFLAQFLILSKSEFNISARISGSFNVNDKLVSSANNLIVDSISFTMLLIYIRYGRGPRTEPCGLTPLQLL